MRIYIEREEERTDATPFRNRAGEKKRERQREEEARSTYTYSSIYPESIRESARRHEKKRTLKEERNGGSSCAMFSCAEGHAIRHLKIRSLIEKKTKEANQTEERSG